MNECLYAKWCRRPAVENSSWCKIHYSEGLKIDIQNQIELARVEGKQK